MIIRFNNKFFPSLLLLLVVTASQNLKAADVYVSDFAVGTVRKFDSSTGNTVPGWTNPTVGQAVGVGLDAAGFLYAVSQSSSSILKFDSTGAAVNTYSVTGLTGGPQGLTVDAAGNAYLTNGTSGLVSVYNASGTLVTANLLGFPVGNPYGITNDASGYLYIAAPATGIVYKVNKTTGVSAPGWTNPTGLNSPTGVALDSAGNLYVTSYNGGFITKYNGTTGASMTYTSPQWNSSFLPAPEGIAIDGDDLYVALTNTVAKYSLSTSQAVAGWSNPSGDSDMIVIRAVVPEPSTYALALIASSAMALIIKRRRSFNQ